MTPKFRLLCDGKHTHAELGGKTIGAGIKAISFEHDVDSAAGIVLDLKIDLAAFEFAEDGQFDKWEHLIKEHEPSVDERLA